MTAQNLAEAIGLVAPYYNLALVIIVVILFGYMLRSAKKEFFILPWKYLFAAVIIYIFEELITVFEVAGIISAPKLLFPILEMGIITLFIYMLLIQKEYIAKLK